MPLQFSGFPMMVERPMAAGSITGRADVIKHVGRCPTSALDGKGKVSGTRFLLITFDLLFSRKEMVEGAV